MPRAKKPPVKPPAAVEVNVRVLGFLGGVATCPRSLSARITMYPESRSALSSVLVDRDHSFHRLLATKT